MLPLQTKEVLSPRNPRRHHATGWVLRHCGAGVWVCLVPFGAIVTMMTGTFANASQTVHSWLPL